MSACQRENCTGVCVRAELMLDCWSGTKNAVDDFLVVTGFYTCHTFQRASATLEASFSFFFLAGGRGGWGTRQVKRKEFVA